MINVSMKIFKTLNFNNELWRENKIGYNNLFLHYRLHG